MQKEHLLIGLGALILSTAALAQTPWENYLELPTPDNAARVQHAVYTNPTSRDNRLFEDLLLLEIQVISADREAVRLAFRLFAESDGHYSETLCIMLGRLIRIDPALFLQELEDHRKQIPHIDDLLGGLLGNHGDAYVDRFRAREYETERRIKALMTVTDPRLKKLRDKCVAELKGQVEIFKAIEPGG
jgi:hypothetical protein